MASDSVRSRPTNYEDSTPEWASDTFAYRSPNKNPFLRFAYPRVKNKQTTPQIYCNAVQIGKFTQLPSEIYIYHGTADYGLVPDLLEGLSVFCVCSLITGHPLCMLGSGELCIPCGERYPGIPAGGWLWSWQNHWIAWRLELYSALERNCRTGWSTETVRVTYNCTLGLQSIHWRFRHSLKRGVFSGGCQAVVEIMCRTNWGTH